MEELRELFESLNPIVQALLAGLFTWTITALGAAMVFLARAISRRLLDGMLGFSGGVMLAASYWSLLAPAVTIAKRGSVPAWIPPVVGFLAGGAVLWVFDKLLPHLHLRFRDSEAEGPRTAWRRAVLLVTAIALHNVPEGLAVGVAFGGIAAGLPEATLGSAITLAFGIGIQNFPEGIAVAMPLRAEGVSRGKSFWYGQLSAAVEPVFAVMGAAAVVMAAPLLPYALSFAAGAMIYVVVEELIPESHRAGNVDLATVSLMLGFALMMMLDVAFA